MARISAFGFGTGNLMAEMSSSGGSPRVVSMNGSGTGLGFVSATATGSVGTLNIGSIAAATNESIVMMRVECEAAPSASRNVFALGRPVVDDWLVFEAINGYGAIRVGVQSGTLTNQSSLTELGTFFGWRWNATNDVWIKWKSDPTTGVCEVRLNGKTPDGWSDISGADTQGASGTDLTRAVASILNSTSQEIILGDILHMDDSGASYNDFLANSPVVVYTPVGGVSAGVDDWTGSDADSVNNHLLIDDAATTSMSDYIESGTATDRQICDVDNVTDDGTIIGVTAVAHAVDADAGSQSVDIGVRSSATETVTAHTLSGTEYQYNSYVWQDPNTAADWASSTPVNAASWVAEVN